MAWPMEGGGEGSVRPDPEPQEAPPGFLCWERRLTLPCDPQRGGHDQAGRGGRQSTGRMWVLPVAERTTEELTDVF